MIGWVLLAIGLDIRRLVPAARRDRPRAADPDRPPLQEAIAWITEMSVSLTFALIATLAFMFPTGRLVVGRWRPFALLALGLIWRIAITSAFWPVLTPTGRRSGWRHHRGPEPDRPPAADDPDVSFPAHGRRPSCRSSSSCPSWRSPVAIGAERPGAPADALARGAFGVHRGRDSRRSPDLALVDPHGAIAWVPASVGVPAPPVAIGIAVTRYRLYEIDRLISRGLSWAVLSGLLLAVYAGAILLLQTVLGDVIQGQTVAVAGSTLLAAALFQPLRRRVQVRGRPPLQPRPLRRRADRDRLRRAASRRDRPSSLRGDFAASWTPPSTRPRSASGSAEPRPTTP